MASPRRRKAVYEIDIGGTPVTSTFAPLLVSLEIELTDGGETDRLIVTLDDTDGQIALPPPRAPIAASLAWDDSPVVASFQGFTDEPKSSGVVPGREAEGGEIDQLLSQGDRGSGRLLTITAHSADLGSAVKQPAQAHADNMSFGDVAQQWGQKAGLSSVFVDPALGSQQRAYWSMGNESYMAWAARTAKELGASFKIIGTMGVFVPRSGGDTSLGGLAVGGISAIWGVNLISWSIAPVLSRPSFGQFQARNWDPQQAQWQQQQPSGSGSSSSSAGGSDVTHTHPYMAPDADQAQQQAQSNSDESQRDRGGADTVTIDGEPAAQPTGTCAVSGIRPGVDGSYTISRVTQRLVRSGGFTTTCAFVQPGGDAGTDNRGG